MKGNRRGREASKSQQTLVEMCLGVFPFNLLVVYARKELEKRVRTGY